MTTRQMATTVIDHYWKFFSPCS